MNRARKIQPVVRKVSFAEAEETDNMYWANTTYEERFNELAELRMMVFGGGGKKMEKVVRKRSLYEEAD
ncbi:hypothetical protein DC498_17375 [Terrimonas sp.]|uniref:hypothetical protein n=1 Tax=Terrimonas sp. TaxID=1914338 RepID=UPI000D511E64|nr:hypothetical protein [Terrimonas sp.]PVD50956.1 hypothetical protein DC498_17375 [Terrimonas sp.]